MTPVNVLAITCIDSASEDTFEVYLKIDSLQQQYPEFLQILTAGEDDLEDGEDLDDNVVIDLSPNAWCDRSPNLDDDTISKYVNILIGNYQKDDCRYSKATDGSVINISFGPTVIY